MSRGRSVRVIVRWVVLGAVVALGAFALMFARGPVFWQRLFCPLHYETQIADSASRHKMSPFLVAAVINVESSWKADDVSGVGAVGLMQVMPETAKDLALSGDVDANRFPRAQLSSPTVNIEYGTAYLRFLMNRYHEVETVLAAYNAGLRHADVWKKKGGDIRTAITFPETKLYVLRVMTGRDRYKALYPKSFE